MIWNQRKISLLEQKEVIEPEVLDQVAKALRVRAEAIKNFDEETAINIISNNSVENCEQPASIFYNSTINPVDKWMEALEENKRLYAALLKEKMKKLLCSKNCLERKPSSLVTSMLKNLLFPLHNFFKDFSNLS